MSAISTPACPVSPVAPVVATSRLADYIEIAKLRISVMVLMTVTVGYLMAVRGEFSFLPLLSACLGVALTAIGSSAVNQWYERETDARMVRTRNRPLPAQRLAPGEVLVFGICCGVVGCLYLYLTVNVATAMMTGVTFLLYTGAYTPLKRVTSLCTAVGAIPGALPPVLGWLAAGGAFDWTAFSLFAVLFLWQFPHFLAIAWIYRDDYCAAGLRMLPAGRSMPHVTGLMAVGYALGLIPVSLLPTYFGAAGMVYATVAVILGLAYLDSSIRFAWQESRASARRVLWTSLVYLPVLLLVLTWDHLRLLDWLRVFHG